MQLNIEMWQKPDTVKMEDILPAPIFEKAQVISIPQKMVQKFAPSYRSEYWINFYSNDGLEGRLNVMESLIRKYADINTKPIDRIGICNEYTEMAEMYNLLVGFECMEVSILKLNIQITNNLPKKVVVNL